MQLPPDHLELLRVFEDRMVKSIPGIRGREPTYFARSQDEDIYTYPEARLAFLGFVAGIHYSRDVFVAAFNKGTS